jgi:hypothetical protein
MFLIIIIIIIIIIINITGLIFYPVGIRDFFLGVREPGSEADLPPITSAEVKNAWSYITTPIRIFMAWYLVKHSYKFT